MIVVDKDQNFTCPSLHTMEDIGSDQREILVTSVFNASAAKGVFHVTENNRYNADLKQNRAQGFLE